MNQNFVSIEALMNQAEDEPAVEEPINGTQTTATAKKNNGNLVMGAPSMPGYITQLANPDGGRIFHVSIDQYVEECAPYYNLMKVLWTANEDDTVYIDIFTYGGQVETGCHIITAMQNTKAKVITRAYGLCCSIGAMIWACGHQKEVTDNATIMFHMPSGGVFGKTADNMEESKNVQEWFTEFMTTVTRGLMTEEELQNVISCRHDLFIPAAVMKERLAALEPKASTEQMGGGDILKAKKYGKVGVSDYVKEDFKDCGIELCANRPPRQLIFTRDEIADNNIRWTFFLTESPSDRMLRDFVHKMHLPAENDEVVIHAPSEIDIDTAEIISSAIQCCRGHVTISAPYILNSPAAYVATSGDTMVNYNYGIMVINLPSIASYGKVIDTDNAVRIHKTRILHILHALKEKGFIPTDEDFLHIVKEQGSYCIHGEKLKACVDAMNAKNQES